MNEFLRLGKLIGVMSVLAVVVSGCGSASQQTGRDKYRPLNFDKDPWLSGFNKEYEIAIRTNANWVENPEKIALRLAGATNPTKISTFDMGRGRITVIVLQDPVVGDDSVAAEEIRADLVQKGNKWEIKWAGGRWRCHAGRGHTSWGAELCR